MASLAQKMILPTGSIRTRVNKSSFGFTLLEMIAVLAMLAAVVAVSVPSLRQFFKSRTLLEESKRMVALTEFARKEAVSIGVPVQILVDLDRKLIFLQREDGYQSENTAFPGPFEIDESIAFDFEMNAPLYGQTYAITFLPDGSLVETSPLTWRIFRENEEDNNRFYRVAKLQGRLRYSLLTPEDNENQFIQQQEILAEPGSLYLR